MSDIIFRFFPALEALLSKILGVLANPVYFIFDLIILFIITKIVISLGNKAITFNKERLIQKGKDEKFVNTICTVLKSVWRYAIYFIAIIVVLSMLNFGSTIASLLATAGIGGLAIAFGAQSLIKDIITGVFLLFENQLAVGDFVTIAGRTGTIEEVQLRVTKVRSAGGEVHIIPNGQIDIVTNFSKGTTKAIIDIPIPYEQDVSQACCVIGEALSKLYDSTENIFADKPLILGTVDLGDSAIIIRAVADCQSMKHGEAERKMRDAVIDAFDKNNISFPYNKIVVLNHD